jgi:hypothetical protein
MNRIVELANASTLPDGMTDDAMQIKCLEATLGLCRDGLQARLAALDESLRIKDMFARHRVVGDIVSGRAIDAEGIEREAIWHMANSCRSEHWDLLAELAIVFERSVTRGEFKSALVTAWKKAGGVTKENLAYSLRRRGFNHFFGVWI